MTYDELPMARVASGDRDRFAGFICLLLVRLGARLPSPDFEERGPIELTQEFILALLLVFRGRDDKVKAVLADIDSNPSHYQLQNIIQSLRASAETPSLLRQVLAADTPGEAKRALDAYLRAHRGISPTILQPRWTDPSDLSSEIHPGKTSGRAP